ncbi:hypothetical protein FGL98_24865 [Leekyejoonella antrihumi]|uniref:Uncharacterized protein n=1 Tax=Leekyejoonella antrihumi TaxID=1660198 RepID=A0A563DNY5_9MICO|nr:hypothetical protein FGL98_24865 [Leekyejoonella antrihumi]
MTRTGSHSSPPCVSAAAPSRRALFPPHDRECLWHNAIRQLLTRLNPTRRARSNPRVVKRKYTKWHVKRAHHAIWTQPTGEPTVAVLDPN